MSPTNNRHPLAVEFGHRIRVRRIAQRLSRAQLAELVGVTDHRIGKIERGDSLSDIDIVVALQSALEFPWDELMGGLSGHRLPRR